MLLNNAYLYASAKERKDMDKKPYYRQSAIAFSIISLMLLLTARAIITDISALINVVIGLAITLVIYVIVSTVQIETRVVNTFPDTR